MSLATPNAEGWFSEGNRYMAGGDDRNAEACFQRPGSTGPMCCCDRGATRRAGGPSKAGTGTPF